MVERKRRTQEVIEREQELAEQVRELGRTMKAQKLESVLSPLRGLRGWWRPYAAAQGPMDRSLSPFSAPL